MNYIANFEKLQVGDRFSTAESMAMKIEEVVPYGDSGRYNAVRLDGAMAGYCFYVDDKMEVELE